jgi:2-phospho-L-lactate guanylyltransferase
VQPDKLIDSGTYALVPVKRLDRAKTRLGAVLSADERRRFCLAMLNDVLNTLSDCPRISAMGLYTSEPAACNVAEARAIETHGEVDGEDLCDGLNRIARTIERRGYDTLLVLPQDVPTLESAELNAFLETHTQLSIGGAPRGGTNLIALSPPTLIPFQFGPDSLALHRRAGMSADAVPRIVEMSSALRDIDLPEDLQWLADQPAKTQAGNWVLDWQGGLPGQPRYAS